MIVRRTKHTHWLSAVYLESILVWAFLCLRIQVSLFAFVSFMWAGICLRACFAHSLTTCPRQSLTSGDHTSAYAL